MAEMKITEANYSDFKCNGVELKYADIKDIKKNDAGKPIVLFKNGVEVTFNSKFSENNNGEGASISLEKDKALVLSNVKDLDVKGTSGSDIIFFDGTCRGIDLKTGAGDDLVLFDNKRTLYDSKIDTGAGDDDLGLAAGTYYNSACKIDLGSGKNNFLTEGVAKFIKKPDATGGQLNSADINNDAEAKMRFILKWPILQR